MRSAGKCPANLHPAKICIPPKSTPAKPLRSTADQRDLTIAIARPASSLSLQLFVMKFSSHACRIRP